MAYKYFARSKPPMATHSGSALLAAFTALSTSVSSASAICARNSLLEGLFESRYFLEYGENALCMHKDAVKPLSRVVIIDDVLATGGTLKASIDLVRQCGGIVEACICLIELEELNGKDAIDVPVFTLVKY